MKNDPRWLVARYPGICAKCGQPFQAGERIFYYPLTRSAFSGACAEAAAIDFRNAVEAEQYA